MLCRARIRIQIQYKTLGAENRRHLSLAYATHEPSNAASNIKHAPIVILHGLFGSKQNNRSISKYASPFLQLYEGKGREANDLGQSTRARPTKTGLCSS